MMSDGYIGLRDGKIIMTSRSITNSLFDVIFIENSSLPNGNSRQLWINILPRERGRGPQIITPEL